MKQKKMVIMLAAVILTACDTSVVCPADLRWRVTPTEADMSVGEVITVSAEALGCGGTEPLEEEMHWSSEDPAVASVDELTGLLRAEALGATRIIGEDHGFYGIGPVEIPVTVEP